MLYNILVWNLIPTPFVFFYPCIYRVIRNDCPGCNNLTYKIHLRQEYVVTPMDLEVYVPPLPASIPELNVKIRTAIETITDDVT